MADTRDEISVPAEQLHLRGLQIERQTRYVRVDGVRRVRLTRDEYKFLIYLAEHAGEVCPRSVTVRVAYGEKETNLVYQPDVDDGRLDARVARIRRKMGDSTKHPRFVKTIYGQGHRLDEYIGEIG